MYPGGWNLTGRRAMPNPGNIAHWTLAKGALIAVARDSPERRAALPRAMTNDGGAG